MATTPKDKPFRPLLAAETPEDLSDLEQHLPLLASYKIDGIRALVRDGQLVSRTMKRIPSAFAQKHFVAPELEGLDGELLVPVQTGPTIYHDTYSAAMTHGSMAPLRYYVFDTTSIGLEAVYQWRLETLLEVVTEHASPLIIPLEQRECHTLQDILDMEQEALDLKHEGLIVRRAGEWYKQGRSTFKQGILIKVARSMTSEAVVLDFEEMMHNDNPAETSALGYTKRKSLMENMRPSGMLGAFWVKDVKSGEKFKVGTGFDHSLRKSLWQWRERQKGKIIKYKYKPYGSKDVPRQPSFLGFRDPSDM